MERLRFGRRSPTSYQHERFAALRCTRLGAVRPVRSRLCHFYVPSLLLSSGYIQATRHNIALDWIEALRSVMRRTEERKNVALWLPSFVSERSHGNLQGRPACLHCRLQKRREHVGENATLRVLLSIMIDTLSAAARRRGNIGPLFLVCWRTQRQEKSQCSLRHNRQQS